MMTRLLRRFLLLAFFLLQLATGGYAQFYFGFEGADGHSPSKTFLDYYYTYTLTVTSVESAIVRAPGVISGMHSIANDPNGLGESSMTFTLGNDKLFDFVSLSLRDLDGLGGQLVFTTSKGSMEFNVDPDESKIIEPDDEIFKGISSVVITSVDRFKFVYDDFIINNLEEVDIIPPTVTSVTTIEDSNTYKIGYEILIQVDFSEDVTVTGSPELTLETGTTDRILSYLEGSGSSSLYFKYTVALGDASTALDYVSQTALAFNGGTIKDAAGNSAELGLPLPGAAGSLSDGKTIVIDGSGLKFDFETATGFATNVISQTAEDYTLRVTGTQPITKDYSAIPQIAATTNAAEQTIEFSMLGHKFDLRTIKFMHHMGGDLLARMTTDKFGQVTLAKSAATKDQEETLRFNGFSFSGITRFTITTSGDPLHFSFDDFIVTNIIPDVVGPSVISVETSKSDGLYKSGDIIPIAIRFNEPVIITGTPQLTLANGGAGRVVDYSAGSGSSVILFDYTVQDGDISSKLNYMATTSLQLNGGTVKDELGNVATLTLPALDGGNNSFSYQEIRIDAATPTVVSVSHATNDAFYKEGATVPIVVTFSEPVTVTGVPQLTLTNEFEGAVVNYTSGTGTEALTFTYTVNAGENASPLNYLATNSLVLNNGSIADAAENAADLTLPALDDPNSLVTSNVTIDTRAPELIDVTSPDGAKTYKPGDVISIDVVFSEPVNLISGTLKLPIEFGGEATYVSGSGTDKHRYNYTVKSGDLATTSASMYPGSLTGGILQDLAGNSLTVPYVPTPGINFLSGQNVRIDGVLPTVTGVTSSTGNGVYAAGNTIAIQVNFGEAVTVEGTPQLTLETGTTDRVINYTSGSGTSTLLFSYLVQTGESSSRLDYTATDALALNGESIRDVAGNDAVLTLATPGAVGSLSNNKNLVIDAIAPTITGVSSSTADGTYKVNDVIAIQVSLSEVVSVSGTPQLTLETGTADRTANYATGSGTNTLTFNYTVTAGDHSTDLDYISTTALVLNGGTIHDAAFNAAVLTLPAPGATGSLGANKALVIIGVPPTVSAVAYNALNGQLTITGTNFVANTGASNDIDVTKFTFTGQGGNGTAVTLNSSVSVEISSSTAITLTISGADKTVLDQILHLNSTKAFDNTTYNLNLAEGWLAGYVLGNASALSTNAITVNGAKPIVITEDPSDNTTTSGRVHATVHDNGANTVTRFRRHGNSSEVSNGSGGDVRAGNSVSAGSGATAVWVDYDGMYPGNTYYYRVEASHDNFVTYSSGALLTLTTPPDPPTIAAASNVSTSGMTLNWDISPSPGTGSYRLDVATDNAFLGTVSGYNNLTIPDRTTASQVLIGLDPATTYYYRLRAESNGHYSAYTATGSQKTTGVLVSSINRTTTAQTNATALSFQITFDIPVTSLDASAFTLTPTGTALGTVGTPTGSGTTWTVPVSGVSGDGTIRLDLSSKTGLSPNAENFYTSGQLYTIDNTAPNAPSAPDMRSLDDTGIYNNDNITFLSQVTFTGTAEAGATVTLYRDGTTPLGSTTATGGVYSIMNNPGLAAGEHQLTVKARDAAGNESAASSALTVHIVGSPPTVQVTSSSPTLKAGETATITFTFSSDTHGTFTWDGTTGDVDVSGGVLSAISGSGTTYTAIFTPNPDTDNGTGNISVPIYSYTDVSGAEGLAGSLSPAISYDTGLPTTTIATLAFSNDTGTPGDYITKTPSQTLSGTTSAILVTGESVEVSIDDGNNWSRATAAVGTSTWSLSDVVFTGSNTIKIQITDAAGNLGTRFSQAYVLDTTVPTLSAVAISSNHSNPALGKTDDVVTLTFTSSEAIQPTTVIIGGHSATPTNSGNTWTATRTIYSDDADGVVTFSIAFRDIAANVGTTVTTTTNSSSVTINRNANLQALTLSTGTLDPVFSSGTQAYTASVPYATTSVKVTPTQDDANAGLELQVNSGSYSPILSGQASADLALNVGDNTIDVKVNAQDGVTTQTYTITVNRAPSADAALASLVLSDGTLSPLFSSGVTTYTASVANTVGSITLTPNTVNANATIEVKVNNEAYETLPGGAESQALALNIGDNTIKVKTTAQDGTTSQEYTITVNRISNDATLSVLSLSGGTLSPVFASGTLAYSAPVNSATTSVTVNPTTSNTRASVQVQVNNDGWINVPQGSASIGLPLNVGDNQVDVKITAQDGTTIETYSVNVFRPSNNADLADLSTAAGAISPGFAKGTTTYTVTVPYTMFSTTVTPTVDQTDASVKVNTVRLASAATSAPLSLNVGANTFVVEVTAQDSTIKTYTLTVIRTAAANNADLAGLIPSVGTLSPVFSAATGNYSLAVDHAVSSITVKPTADQANATITVGGTAVASGAASAPISLVVGANQITAEVTAQDGITKKTYVLTVTRDAGLSSVANLTDLKLSSGALNKPFVSGTTDYTTTLPYATSSITLTATVEQANAAVKVNNVTVDSGINSGAISLNVGANVITVEVTAQDGTTKKGYTITVTRTLAATVANLASLSVNGGTLDPLFSTATSNYSVFVPNTSATTTVTARSEQAGATIKVNGTAVQNLVASGLINLVVGANTITTQVTAEDGLSTKTYTVTVTRLAPGQATTDTNGGVTAGNTVTDVVVTSPVQPITVTIPAGTTTPTVIDYKNITSGGTVPQTTIVSPVAKVEIPASTTITGTNTAWTGVLTAPEVSNYEFPKVKGQTITKGLVIEVGDPNVSLTFTKAVRLVLYGQAGMRVARIHNKVYEEISTIGAADTQDEGDKLAPAAAFKINVGRDLVIWTKGFSQFITFTQSVNLDEAVAAADLAALTVDKIVGAGSTPTAVTGPLTLPSAGSNGSTITWASNQPGVISNDGQSVNRPVMGSGNATVTLTGTIRRGTATETVSFNLTVPEAPNTAPTLNAVANQTVCPVTTLQNVPLSGLSAGAESNQNFTMSVTSNNNSMFASLAVAGGNTSTGVFSYILRPNASGTATVTITVKDNGGIADGGTDTFTRSFTITVNVPPVVTIASSMGSQIDKGRTTQLTASGGISYVWTTAAGIVSGQNTATLTVRPAVTTTYIVTATNASGCSATQTFMVHVGNTINAVHANNIISPNGDGQNDKLVFENLDMFPGHTLKIFNRAGRVLYQKTNYTNDWEGTFQGAPLAEDTYYYIVDFGSGLGVRKGFVSVVR